MGRKRYTSTANPATVLPLLGLFLRRWRRQRSDELLQLVDYGERGGEIERESVCVFVFVSVSVSVSA